MISGPVTSRTIPGLLDRAASRNPDGIWLRADAEHWAGHGAAGHGAAGTSAAGTSAAGSSAGRTSAAGLTFAGAAGRAGAVAAALREAGVRRGDLVVLTARSTPPYLMCWLALASLGAVSVATNPRSAPAELAGLVRQVSPRALITDAGLAGLVDAAGIRDLPELGSLDVGALGADPGAAHPASAALPDAGVRPDDLAVLIPTSGTTGRSKLVMQTHRAYAMAGEGFPFWMELTAADRLMTSLPLFHINAPAYSVMGSLACGAGLVLLPRFSASGFLDAARRHGATEFNAIGAMLEILMRQPPCADDADSPLRLCYTGPAPERGRQEEIEARFGLRIVVGYAMSESPYGLIWPRGTRPFGTLGAVRQHPVLGVVNEARVVDEAGADLGPGETGELLLRNPVITPGYWAMREETARVITGGWLHTGDLVTVGGDGTYTFVSRVKEVLRRRGENLSPLEVEEVLAAHPAVLECAVTGVPSDLSEEDVKAFVVAADGAALDFAALREYTAGRLAAFKVPRYWQQVDQLPRTPTARVAKHRLPAGHPPGEYDAEAAAPGDGAAGRNRAGGKDQP
ncbi:MAG TPA: AMP-binding protein [Streptosporangiaceae bacterium]|nr:AMP-binding protein [Streptosporangiaceae bacterium]